mmetsp:Transcript_54227/g.65405  ORF Transcript_54227/g.65405 Transcript_54227/m.65405 type:complete len:221 (-) Transcript_54227:2221-2883(-)
MSTSLSLLFFLISDTYFSNLFTLSPYDDFILSISSTKVLICLSFFSTVFSNSVTVSWIVNNRLLNLSLSLVSCSLSFANAMISDSSLFFLWISVELLSSRDDISFFSCCCRVSFDALSCAIFLSYSFTLSSSSNFPRDISPTAILSAVFVSSFVDGFAWAPSPSSCLHSDRLQPIPLLNFDLDSCTFVANFSFNVFMAASLLLSRANKLVFTICNESRAS